MHTATRMTTNHNQARGGNQQGHLQPPCPARLSQLFPAQALFPPPSSPKEHLPGLQSECFSSASCILNCLSLKTTSRGRHDYYPHFSDRERDERRVEANRPRLYNYKGQKQDLTGGAQTAESVRDLEGRRDVDPITLKSPPLPPDSGRRSHQMPFLGTDFGTHLFRAP